MNRLSQIALSLCAFAVSVITASSMDLEPLLESSTPSTDVARLLPAERARLLRELKEAPIPLRRRYGSKVDTLLIEIADRRTLSDLLEEKFWQTGPVGRGVFGKQMVRTGQLLLIRELSNALYIDEPAEEFIQEDVGVLPVLTWAAWVTSQVLLNSPIPSSDVKQWAGTFSIIRDPEKLREGMREFWRDNEQIINSENFAALRPLGSRPVSLL